MADQVARAHASTVAQVATLQSALQQVTQELCSAQAVHIDDRAIALYEIETLRAQLARAQSVRTQSACAQSACAQSASAQLAGPVFAEQERSVHNDERAKLLCEIETLRAQLAAAQTDSSGTIGKAGSPSAECAQEMRAPAKCAQQEGALAATDTAGVASVTIRDEAVSHVQGHLAAPSSAMKAQLMAVTHRCRELEQQSVQLEVCSFHFIVIIKHQAFVVLQRHGES